MENLVFCTGKKDFLLNGHLFRFNPSDPGLYSKLLTAAGKIQAMQAEFCCAGEMSAADVLRIFEEADARAKRILAEVFPGNDFFEIFDGVNIVARNLKGNRVIDGFFDAIRPVVVEGMREMFRADMAAVKKYTAAYE